MYMHIGNPPVAMSDVQNPVYDVVTESNPANQMVTSDQVKKGPDPIYQVPVLSFSRSGILDPESDKPVQQSNQVKKGPDPAYQVPVLALSRSGILDPESDKPVQQSNQVKKGPDPAYQVPFDPESDISLTGFPI